MKHIKSKLLNTERFCHLNVAWYVSKKCSIVLIWLIMKLDIQTAIFHNQIKKNTKGEYTSSWIKTCFFFKCQFRITWFSIKYECCR